MIFVIKQTVSSTPHHPQDKSSVKGKVNKRRRSEPSPPPANRIAGGETLETYCGHAFVRKLTPSFVPEIISRCGNRWNAAANKPNAASIMRYLVTSLDIHRLGASYIGLQGNSKKAEEYVVGRVLRAGAHAVRGHRHRVADTVRHLLLEQTVDDPEMEYVKETVFGVSGGAPRCCQFIIYECINYKPLTVFGRACQVESRSCRWFWAGRRDWSAWRALTLSGRSFSTCMKVRLIQTYSRPPPATCVLNVVIPGHCNKHFLDAGGAPAAKLKVFETGDNDFTVLDHGMLPPQMALLKLLGKWYIP